MNEKEESNKVWGIDNLMDHKTRLDFYISGFKERGTILIYTNFSLMVTFLHEESNQIVYETA